MLAPTRGTSDSCRGGLRSRPGVHALVGRRPGTVAAGRVEQRIDIEVSGDSSRYAVLMQQSFALKAEALEQPDRRMVTGHDVCVNAVEPCGVERPEQQLVQGSAHDAAAPERGRKVVDQFR